MPLQKNTFVPGINREGTAYDNEGGWFDCNLIRFRAGRPEKFGGWGKLLSATYQGTARALHNFISLAGTKYLGIGTHFKYYIVENNDAFNDITPIRKTVGAGQTDTTATTFAKVGNDDATITVTNNSHGAVQNDFVTFSGAASLGGNITAAVLNQEYQIATVTDGNTYTIEAKDTSGNTVLANSSDSGTGGGSVVSAYQINTGLDVFVSSTGWGANSWGSSGWGSTTPLSDTNQLRIWTHDNYGEDLILNVRGGGVYRWVENNGTSTRASLLSSATGANQVPTAALQVLTSEVDRHLIVLGADPLNTSNVRTGTLDPMLVAFSDQENPLDFETKATNSAGELRLSSGSLIVGAVKSRQETVIFTDTSVYSMQFIGPPFTFGLNLINESTGLIGPKAAVTAPNGVYYMSYDSFYVYSGSVQQIPCTVRNYVFSDINQSQAYKINAFTNNKHSEVGWFYPSASSTEIDRYVIYNYAESVWYYGQLSRTAWLDSNIESYPQAVSGGYLYEHEKGFDNDGSEMTNVFIESSDFDIGDGDSFSFLRRLIPDIKFLDDDASSNVNIVTKTRNFPGDSLSTDSTSLITPSTQQSHIRARGRQAVVRISSNDGNSGNVGVGWRLGAIRYDIRPDGRR
tara:strand:- start:2006 stop:3892 length:1887 start_codon:yes stop_codon:yes gene_type:complete